MHDSSTLVVPLLPAVALVLSILIAWGKLAGDYGRQTATMAAMARSMESFTVALNRQSESFSVAMDKQNEIITSLRRDRHTARSDIQTLSMVVTLMLDDQFSAAKAAMGRIGTGQHP